MATVDVFGRCSEINDLLNQGLTEEARSEVIKLLQRSKGNVSPYEELVNHLIREVGLYPYIHSENASWEDAFAYEAFKVNTGVKEETLHLAQSEVLSALLKGESIAVSAPTSFGKSFVIDAFIAIKEPQNVVIIVPTIALADETRRRLYRKFSSRYKIITTTSESLAERNILILPQERAFAFIDSLEEIDILIVDEFYKASTAFEKENERANSLLTVMAKLGAKSKQRYYLAPNIHAMQPNVFTEGMRFMRMDFKTVITIAKRVYRERRDDESQDAFVERMLPALLERNKSKTLVYAGSYDKIKKASNLLVKTIDEKPSQNLVYFADWLRKNYSPNFMLAKLAARGVGVHNGSLHRSLAQIQIKLFEEQEGGIETILSTSSIIEGVNTQAENVILLSNTNGSRSMFDYFTYRNIIGRAGRMFRYFVGRVFLLVKPPEQADTLLNLDFPDDVALLLDPDNPGVELNQDQRELQRKYHAEMEDLIGTNHYHNLKELPIVQAASPTVFREMVETIVVNPEWPTNHRALLRYRTFDWREPLDEVIRAFGGGNARNMQIAVWKMSENWNQSTSAVIAELGDWGVPVDDFFSLERSISYNLSTTIALINAIRLELVEGAVDLSPFVNRLSYAFLPRLVYQLEEYGLPRMISKQLSRAGMFDFENEEKEISDIIVEFQQVGYERVVEALPNKHPFDEYVLKHFFDGIRKN